MPGLARIVVIEDEADIAEIIRLNLAAEGYEVQSFSSGREGLSAVTAAPPDLVLLDLMLPEMDGLDVCRAIKADPGAADVPVLIVSAKGKESDVVLGLGLGADDYIPKPFRVGELVARVKAALRRGSRRSIPAEPRLSYGQLELRPDAFSATLDGEPLVLTATEFRLLSLLAARPGKVFSRQQLMDKCIGEDVLVSERTIDTHLGAVRRKLGRLRGMICTVWGVGYRFDPEAAEEADEA
ncbi:response regulator transcription factor [bacterium]|nr:response regulator transcription factor [bacterium]